MNSTHGGTEDEAAKIRQNGNSGSQKKEKMVYWEKDGQMTDGRRGSVENRREWKHRVLEVLEGGLRGNPAARAFSWLLIILIILSILFMVLMNVDGTEPWHRTFEIIETVTIGIFTLELLLGSWTADVRFPEEAHPQRRYWTLFMTIVQILAILPFYLGLILQDTAYEEVAEFFELLKLLHLLKIGELCLHAWKKDKEEGR